MVEFILFILTGAIAGVLSGLLGIGGGVIVVPSLLFLFNLYQTSFINNMHMAAGTSLAVMIITTTVTTFSYHQRGSVLWSVFATLLPGIVVGVSTGVMLAGLLHTKILSILFALFEFFIAIRMFLGIQPPPDRNLPHSFTMRLFSIIVGMKSGLLGVGGGTFTVPFLSRCNVSMTNAAGTSAACGLTIAIVGSMGFMLIGMTNTQHIPYSSGYIYWPAFLGVGLGSLCFASFGTYLAHEINVKKMKKIFALVLIVVGIKMLC